MTRVAGVAVHEEAKTRLLLSTSFPDGPSLTTWTAADTPENLARFQELANRFLLDPEHGYVSLSRERTTVEVEAIVQRNDLPNGQLFKLTSVIPAT